MRDTSILLADDHPRVLEGLVKLLKPEFTVVGTASDGAELIVSALELRPQVIVTDLAMEPTSGLEAAAVILDRSDPKPAIVMLTAIEDEEVVRQAFAIGILGYVSKTRLSEDLIPAIEAAMSGSQFLSGLI